DLTWVLLGLFLA
ncbi:bacterial extracellular solute-binding s, 5 Middle family protein, partial [Vibrio parahaemolyticus V-223/04]